MLKNYFISFVTASTLFISSAYAMQLNVTVGDEIKNNRDQPSFSYDLYYNVSGVSQQQLNSKISGLPAEKVPAFLATFKDLFAEIQPVDSVNGKHSQIAFGYTKADGTEIYPASCQTIIAKPIMNITFNENGCIVR